jgi:hypothetical protein
MKHWLCLTVVLSLVAAAGCNSPNAASSLSGKVTYNNNPVTGGTVTLWAKKEGAPPFGGIIDVNGNYSVADVAPGDYTVAIETESINPTKPQPRSTGPAGAGGGTTPGGSSPPGGGPTAPTGKYVKIDSKYSAKETSTLSVTINSGGGKQTQDFPLTGP